MLKWAECDCLDLDEGHEPCTRLMAFPHTRLEFLSEFAREVVVRTLSRKTRGLATPLSCTLTIVLYYHVPPRSQITNR